jgi:hypothetical protein
MGKPSSIRRACNNEIVKSSFNLQLHPGVGIAGAPQIPRPPQLGISSAKIELLEQMKRLRLGTGEVVPCVLPPKAVQALVEIFRLKPPLGADAVDFVLGADAVPDAAEVLRRRRSILKGYI